MATCLYGAPTNIPPTTNSTVAVIVPAHVTPLQGQLPQYDAGGLCEWTSPTNLQYTVTNVNWGSISGTIANQTDYNVQYTNLMYLTTNGLAEDQAEIDTLVATNHEGNLSFTGTMNVHGDEVHSGDTLDARTIRAQRHNVTYWPETNDLPAYIYLGWTNENKGYYYVSIPTTCEFTNSAGLMVVWTNLNRWAVTRSGSQPTFYSSTADFDEGPFAADWHDFKGFDFGSYASQWYEIDQSKVDEWDSGATTTAMLTNYVRLHNTGDVHIVGTLDVDGVTETSQLNIDGATDDWWLDEFGGRWLYLYHGHYTNTADRMWGVYDSATTYFWLNMNLDMNGHSLTNVSTNSIVFNDGSRISAANDLLYYTSADKATTNELTSTATAAAFIAATNTLQTDIDTRATSAAFIASTNTLQGQITSLITGTGTLETAVTALEATVLTNATLTASNAFALTLTTPVATFHYSTNNSSFTNDAGYTTATATEDWTLGPYTLIGDEATVYIALDGTNGLGVNKTNAMAALDVNGSARFSGVTGPAVAGKIIYVASSTTQGVYQFYDGDEWISMATGTVSSTGAVWTTSGSDVYRSGGGVGVATTNVTHTLTVNGTMYVGGAMTLNNTDLSGIDDLTVNDHISCDSIIIDGWTFEESGTSLELWCPSGFATMRFYDSTTGTRSLWPFTGASTIRAVGQIYGPAATTSTSMVNRAFGDTRYLAPATANAASIVSLNTASNSLNTKLNTLTSRFGTTSNQVAANVVSLAAMTAATNALEADVIRLVAATNALVADIAALVAVDITLTNSTAILSTATNNLNTRLIAATNSLYTLIDQTNTFLTAADNVLTNAIAAGIGTGNGSITITNNQVSIVFPRRSDLAEWAYNVAAADVDFNDRNLLNGGILFCTQIVLNGSALTNWNQAAFNPGGNPVGSGTTTITIEYPNRADAGLWHGYSGTLYCYMWKNAEMYGYPEWSTNWAVSGNLAFTTTKTITNTSDFIGDTYWYMWFDVDGDGVFNNLASVSPSGGNLLEPGALGEFMPLYYTNMNDVGTLTFVLVDMKGHTYRYGWETPPTPTIQQTLYELSPTVKKLESTLFHRNFVCEQDYMIDGYSDGGIIGSDVGDYTFIVLNQGSLWAAKYSFEHQSPSGGGVPVPNYPVSGQTLASQDIIFKWTNNYRDLSIVRLRLSTSITGSPVFYEQYDYMENEHIDGTVRLLMSPNRGGPTLANGTTYYWQIGLGNPGTISLTSTWGATASFKYQP